MFNQQVSALQQQVTTLTAANAKLTSDLAAANASLASYAGMNDRMASMQTQMNTLKTQVATLTAENATLKTALDTANLTLASFVKRLMTGKTDANVAAVARDAAQQQVALATAKVGARDPRIRHAQRELSEGSTAFSAGHFQKALKDFGEAFDIAHRILR
jgi:chromosome segregation ATPase